MNKMGVLIASTLVVMATTAAFADPVPVQGPGGVQEMMAPAPLSPPPSGQSGNLPLFTIGQTPVEVWAPVEAPYDANMNRNQGANPIWGTEMSDSER